MSNYCRLCGSSDLSSSHFRLRDLPRLLLLRYPMRCWVCRQRDYFPLLRIFSRGRYTQPQEGTASNLRKA